LPDVELVFVDRELRGCTVGDVLRDPARFENATLADPIEGPSYGRTTAKVMRRKTDGRPWIKSFAHGGVTYSLALAASGPDFIASQRPLRGDEHALLWAAGRLLDHYPPREALDRLLKWAGNKFAPDRTMQIFEMLLDAEIAK
jgi:hypothetical protein